MTDFFFGREIRDLQITFDNIIQYLYLITSQKWVKIKYVKTQHLTFSAIILKFA